MKKLRVLFAFAILGATLIPVLAGNYPMFRGIPSRQGNPSTTATENALNGYLTWYFPKFKDVGRTLLLDDDPNYGQNSTALTDPGNFITGPTFVGPWTQFTNGNKDAVGGQIGDTYYATQAQPSTQTNPNTATWNFTFSKPRRYALSVHFPSSGTSFGGSEREQTSAAIYRVSYGDNQTIDILVDQSQGNSWVNIGDGLSFPTLPNNTLKVTLLASTEDDIGFNGKKKLVMVDAIQATPITGTAYSSPAEQDPDGGSTVTTYTARNEEISDPNDSTNLSTLSTGVVYALKDTGDVRWRFPLANVAGNSNVVDNILSSSDDSFTAPDKSIWQVAPAADITNSSPYGLDFLEGTPNTTSAKASATWKLKTPSGSTISYGNFNVYVWIPKDVNDKFALDAQYIVHYSDIDNTGAIAAKTSIFTINQNNPQGITGDSTAGRWVQLGLGAFLHTKKFGLEVELTNFSGDPNRRVIADAISFVGSSTSPIYSNPTVTQVNLNGIGSTWVTLISSNDGHLYCLDAKGDGNGSTWAYWVYPSLVKPELDPNKNVMYSGGNNGRDHDAPLLTGFAFCSPVYDATTNQVFITNENGRLYAIDAGGRTDVSSAQSTRKPGTTFRKWTFPNVLLNDDKGTALVTTEPAVSVGITGSPALDSGNVYFGGLNGRLYSVSAIGDTTQAVKSKKNWVYPAEADSTSPGAPNLGQISGTPAVDANNVYFNATESNYGHVYSIDKASGNLAWKYPSTGSTILPASFDYTSPLLTQIDAGGLIDAVICGSNDGKFYALRAGGTGAGGLIYKTEAFQGKINSSPVAVNLNPRAANATGSNRKAVVFGTAAGQIGAFAANLHEDNTDKTRYIWGYAAADGGASIFASPAAANGGIYIAETDGFIFKFSNTFGGGGSTPFNDDGFGTPVVGEGLNSVGNQVPVTDYTKFKFGVIDYKTYQALQQGTVKSATDIKTIDKTTFDWGDRIFLVFYSFSYLPSDRNHPEDPNLRGLTPTVTLLLNNKDSHMQVSNFNVKTFSTATPDKEGRLAGYAVAQYDFIFQYGANQWLTPGEAFTITINSRAGNNLFTKQLDTLYKLANPLTLLNNGVASGGWPETVKDPATSAFNGNPFTSYPLGTVPHGTAAGVNFLIADRSVLAVNSNSRQPLTGVRASTTDIAFLGGQAAVYKPIKAFEVMPNLNTPDKPNSNTSLDYPDIDLRQESVILSRTNTDLSSSQGGNVRYGVNLTNNTLAAPIIQSGYQPNDPATWFNRTITPDPVQLNLSVPLFQPPSLSGYQGDVYIYVDVDANHEFTGGPGSLLLTPPVTNVEPYRMISPSVYVPISEKLSIDEDVVDLGSLTHGALIDGGSATSYNNRAYPQDYLKGGLESPYKSFFRPFTVRNLSNVNMLNVRLLRSFRNPSYNPVQLSADTVSGQDWLSGDALFISNLDAKFDNGSSYQRMYQGSAINTRTSGLGTPTLHKSRPGDRTGTVMTIPDTAYNTEPPVNSQPMIAMSIPVGQPVGTYSALVGVVEDTNQSTGQPSTNSGVLDFLNGQPVEAVSNPSMRLTLRVREARLTNDTTKGNIVQIDNPTPNAAFASSNVMPAGWRTSAGDLGLIFISNRPSFAQNQPSTNWFLNTATLKGTNKRPAGLPLGDLYGFSPNSSTEWWKTGVSGYPTLAVSDSTLFTQVDGALVLDSVGFGSPSLPIPTGSERPSVATNFDDPFVYFVGQAYKRISRGATNAGANLMENDILYARASEIQAGTTPHQLNITTTAGEGHSDPSMAKYRPKAIYLSENSTNTALFWAGATTGTYRLFYTIGDPIANSWNNVQELTTPNALSSANNPFPVRRIDSNGRSYIDLFYEGTSRDRGATEIFVNRYPVRGNSLGRPTSFEPIKNEPMERVGNQPVWRSRHLSWLMVSAPPTISVQGKSEAGATVLVNSNDWNQDTNTGLWSAKSALGGLAVADASAGTVRFTSTAPFSGDKVLLTYTPQTKRMTQPTRGGAVKPVVFFDKRVSSDRTLVYKNSTLQNPSSAPLFTADRMFMFYGSIGSTSSENTKLKYRSLRYGVTLSHPVKTVVRASDGVLAASIVAISGEKSRFQVDPGLFSGQNIVPGHLFFEESQETIPPPGQNQNIASSNAITVSYIAADTGQTVTDVFDGSDYNRSLPTWIDESGERDLPIEQIVNEQNLAVYPDLSGGTDEIWLYWNSSRGGTDDIYSMTIAPRFGIYSKSQ